MQILYPKRDSSPCMTYERILYIVAHHQLLCGFLGNVNAEEITGEMIEKWMTSMDVAKVTANMYYRCVRAMFYWAFEQEMISINPFANGKIKQFKVADSDPEKYFSLKEIELILNECKSYDI